MIRQGFVMLVLTALSQVLLFGSMLIVARCYAPAAVGVLSQVSAWLLLFAPWAALCLPHAFALSQSDAEKTLLMKLSRLIVLCTSVVTILLLVLATDTDNVVAGIWFPLLLWLALYSSAMQQVYQQWLLAKGRFLLAALLLFIAGLMLASGRVALSLTESAYQLLIVLTLLVPIGAAGASAIFSGRHSARLSWTSAVSTVKKYRQFPLFQTPQVALNAVSLQGPLLLFGIWYGDGLTGHYALAIAVLGAPASLLGKVVGDWLYPQLAAARGTPEFFRLLRNATLGLAAAGLLPMLVLLISAEQLFVFAFGDSWQLAGQYAIVLTPWFWLVAVNAPALKGLMALQGQGYSLLLNIISVLLRFSGIIVLYLLQQDVFMSVAWLALCGVLHNMLLIGLAFVLSHIAASGGRESHAEV